MADVLALCDVGRVMEFAQTRTRTHRHFVSERQSLLERVRAEYREMPGLSLSLAQGARLLGLDRALCDDVFHALIREGFLRKTPRGDYRLAE
jgi:hypothetical protein